LKQKDKNEIKKLLIDSMAFLKVEAYSGISDAVEKIGDIIDEDSYDKDDYEEDENLDEQDYGDPDYEDEEEHDSSF
jgi:hypothetical protein